MDFPGEIFVFKNSCKNDDTIDEKYVFKTNGAKETLIFYIDHMFYSQYYTINIIIPIQNHTLIKS